MINTTETETVRLGEEIAEIAAHLDAATHRLLRCIREFDEKEGWAEQGALSCAHWLAWRIGVDLRTAREQVRVARVLKDLPHIDEALRLGKLSYSKVRALTRVATPENEVALLAIAQSSTGSQLERISRKYGQAIASSREELAELQARRSLSHYPTEAGMVRIQVDLLPAEAEVVLKAIEAARFRSTKCSAEHLREARVGTANTLSQVDALVVVAEQFLTSDQTSSSAPPYQVMVHVTEEKDAFLDDGTPIAPQHAELISCDANIIEVTDGPDGTPLDVGRKRRTVPTRLRRALKLRDQGCRFPGCTNRLFVDAHHLRHWAHGGETNLSNLVELCRPHHTWVHEQGYSIERAGPLREAQGGLQRDNFIFLKPDGTPLKNVPSPIEIDLSPTAWMSEPGWDLVEASDPEATWEPIDYGLVIAAG